VDFLLESNQGVLLAPNETAGEQGATKKVVLAPGTVITPDAPVVVPETKAKISLVIVGSVLLVAFVVGIGLSRIYGNETKEVSSPATTAAGTTGATGATGQTGATGATEVAKKTTTKTWASDGLLRPRSDLQPANDAQVCGRRGLSQGRGEGEGKGEGG